MRCCTISAMRDLLIALGIPLAFLIAAFTPVYLASNHVQPGYEEHARRLRTQASHWSDLRPGWPHIVELEPQAGTDSPDAVTGTIEWLGPFAVPVLKVTLAPRSGQATHHTWQAILAWTTLLAGVFLPPALVLRHHTRT